MKNPSWRKRQKEEKKEDERDIMIHNLLRELTTMRVRLMKKQREYWDERKRLQKFWKRTCLCFFIVGICIGLIFGWIFL